MGLLNFWKKPNFNDRALAYMPGSRNSYAYISEALRGLVKIDKVQFPKELGEAHPFDFSIPDKLCKKYGLVNAIVDTHIDYILSGGISVQSEDDKSQQIIEDFMVDISFVPTVRPWLKEAFMKGTGFQEMGGQKGGLIEGFKTLCSDYMFINRKENGELDDNVPYKQFTKPLTGWKNRKENDVEIFKEYEIACLPINRYGDSVYGMGIIMPLIGLVDNLLGSNKEMHNLMKRKANSPLIFIGGSKDKGHFPTQGQMDTMGQSLENLHNKNEWVITDFWKPMTIDFGNIGDKFSYIIENDKETLFEAAQVPSVIMGKANVPEGLAKEQGRRWSLRIQSLREEIEKVIEEKIFKRILQANGLDTHVEIIWGVPSQDEKNEKARILIEAIKNPFMMESLREGLQYKLGEVFDIPMEELESGEDERKREEEDEEQPIAPTQRQSPPGEHIHESLEVIRNMKVEEWIGFNYGKYKKDVLNVVQKDGFNLLHGKTRTELSAGLLNSNEIEKLRTTLYDGFEDNMTIREMERLLNRRIIFKDRLRMKDGKLIVKDGNYVLSLPADLRANMITRTETVRLSNLGAVDNYKDNKVDKIRWVSAISDRTCPACLDLNGQILPIDTDTLPPIHVDCRCTTIPVVE